MLRREKRLKHLTDLSVHPDAYACMPVCECKREKIRLRDAGAGLACARRMSLQLFPNPLLPATRSTALEQLERFARRANRYAYERNHVVEQHRNVSQLSAAIQHRLISQQEVIDATLRHHSFSAVEKFIQEIVWRSYWKGWLEMRPSVWSHYLSASVTASDDLLVRAAAVAAGKSGCTVMDEFAQELLETGYLHNHARMWWASFWIHQQRLPWALGAKHFMDHLLDADAASNTLSWRWVAGLQTEGKTYLVRRDNIERYHHAPNLRGIEMLENVSPCPMPCRIDAPLIAYQEYATSVAASDKKMALLIHEEDLSVETTTVGSLHFEALFCWSPLPSPSASARTQWRQLAIADACKRVSDHFGIPCSAIENLDSLISAIQQQQIKHVVLMAPFIGPLHDSLTGLHEHLSQHGIELTLLRREEDNRYFPYAKSGFFPFWKKASRHFA